MPTSDLVEILLRHDVWATRQILAACERLTAEQFGRQFEMGPGSLQATITHIIGAIDAWSDTLAGRAHRPRIEESGVPYSAGQLQELLTAATEEFGALARAHPLDEIVKRERGGKEYAYTRGAVVGHVATHGMHHRAQCLNMLRQLGVKTLPPSSVTEWARMVDFPQ